MIEIIKGQPISGKSNNTDKISVNIVPGVSISTGQMVGKFDEKALSQTPTMQKEISAFDKIVLDSAKAKLFKGENLNASERGLVGKYGLSGFSSLQTSEVFDLFANDNPQNTSRFEKIKIIKNKEDKGKTLTEEEKDFVETTKLINSLKRGYASNLSSLTADINQNATKMETSKAMDLYNDAAYEDDEILRNYNKGKLYVNTGLTSYFEGNANTLNAITSLITGAKPEDAVTGDNSYAIANAALKEYYHRNGENVNSFIQDIAVNMAQNSIPMLMSMAGGIAGGETLARLLSSATMAPSVFGNAYKEGVQLGVKDQGKLLLYSSLVTASELSLEYLLGSVPNTAGGVLSGELLESVSKSVNNVLFKATIKTMGNGLSEFTEESIQGIISPLLQRYILGADVDTIIQNPIESLSESAYSGLVGFVTSILTGGYSNLKNSINESIIQQNGKIYNDIMQQLQLDIKDVASFFKETSQNKEITKVADKILKGDNSDLTVGEFITDVINDTKNSSNSFYATIGQKIFSIENGVETVLNTYETAVEHGAIFSEEVGYLYNQTKENFANNNIDTVTVGEFAFKLQAKLPNAQIFGKLTEHITAEQNPQSQTNGESDVVFDSTSNTALSEAEQKLIDTPDSELTPEQRAVKQTILERQQKNITRNGDVDGGEVGFGEPTTKEIYRKSTAEEEKEALFGKRKDAKQRHILDVAKKLDSDMTVVFVDPDNKKLSGRAGVFIHNTNTMYLSNDNSVVGMYCQLFKHEFVHRLESKGAYQSFKNYLLKHSSAFENYVRAKLRAINGTEFDGTREEALNAFRDYYIGLVQNGDFTAEYKRNFTAEYAEREMVADFVGEILFKGKEKRADVAQNLADGEIDKIIKLEDTFAEFENLNETERSWFRKAIDVIKDWIASLKGIKQNERLVNDLEYIEKRLSRVLDSKDTKKAASKAVDREFSIKSFKDGRQFVDVDVEQERFDGLNDSELRREAKKVIKEKFLGKVIGENNRAYVKKDSAEEYAYPSKYIQDSDIIEAKMRASTELDNLIDVGDNYRNEPDGKYGHSHPEATGGFDYYDAIFKVGNKYYYGLVNIMVTNRGKVFKDLTKIEDITNDIIAQYGNNPQGDFVGTSSTDIILNEEDSVKNNVSSESENYSEDSGEIKQSFALEIPSKQENEDGLSSLGSPMQIARENLIKYENGELTREQYLEENERLWGEAIEKYGSIPEGENADAPIVTPKAVEEGKLTERFVRTIIETGKLTEEAFENIEEKVLLGDFSYKAVSDEASIKKADTAIKNGTAEDIWENTVNSDKYIRKENIAIGEQLLADAIQKGDAKRVLELSSELADIFTRAGQVVQAAQLLKKMTGAGRLISAQRVVKTINKDLAQKYGVTRKPVKISTEAAERLANAKTEKGIEHAYGEIMQEVADQMPSTFIDKFNAWRYWAMLSGPRTHIRNIVGNAIFLPMVRAKNTIAYVLENAAVKKGKLDVADRTKSLVIKKEYADFAKNDGNNAKVTELLKGNKYNDKSVIKEKQKIFKTEALNFLTELNSNLLESEDMLFKNKHYVHALASFLQSRNADLNNLSEELLADARIYAVKEAKKATFNDENAIADYIQQFSNKNLATAIAVEGILPYKRTPLNIIRRGVEYSPIGLGTAITKGTYDVKKGKITVSEYIDGLAAGLTGTGVMLVGMLLANLGIVVGGLGDDDESFFQKLMGKQEYSIEILGKSYTIDWAAPSIIPFMLGAEIINTMREGEELNLSDVLNVAGNILEPITELSCLSGISGVIESAKYANGSQALIAITSDVMLSYATQSIPALLGATARTIDKTQRSWYIDKNSKWFDTVSQTAWNNIRSKIPGLTYTQNPKINAWGQEVSRGGAGERLAENFVSPGYYSQVDYNDMNNELLRLGKATGENIYPKTAPKFFTVNGETKLLTADEYVTYAKAKGQYSHDYVDELMAKKSYNKLTDEEKAKVIKNLYEYANAKAKTTVSDYDLNKQYKTVTHWERNGNSAVDYYIAKAIKD